MAKRVVITGLGVISPVGIGKDAFWRGLLQGKSGVCRITRFDASHYPTKVAGEVHGFEPAEYMPSEVADRMGRAAQFAVASASMALADAGLNLEQVAACRGGVVFGVDGSAVDLIEAQGDILLQEQGAAKKFVSLGLNSLSTSGVASEASVATGLRTLVMSMGAGCCSGINATGLAFNEIRQGKLDVAVSGGTAAPITRYAFLGLCLLKIMTTSEEDPHTVSRPFDRMRHGGVISEGAAAVVLEELEHALQRGAPIYAEVVGFTTIGNTDGQSETQPIRRGLAKTMSRALTDARIAPAEIDYINASAPSLQSVDKMETLAIKDVFGKHAYHIPVSSIKSMIGNPMEASGSTQLVSLARALEEGFVPPTTNYEYLDPDCDLDYVPNVARRNDLNYALLNCHAIDGTDSTLVARKFIG